MSSFERVELLHVWHVCLILFPLQRERHLADVSCPVTDSRECDRCCQFSYVANVAAWHRKVFKYSATQDQYHFTGLSLLPKKTTECIGQLLGQL